MADKVQAELLRPLNGEEIGTVVEYDKRDARRLEERGCVKILGPAAPENKEAKVAETKPRQPKATEKKDD